MTTPSPDRARALLDLLVPDFEKDSTIIATQLRAELEEAGKLTPEAVSAVEQFRQALTSAYPAHLESAVKLVQDTFSTEECEALLVFQRNPAALLPELHVSIHNKTHEYVNTAMSTSPAWKVLMGFVGAFTRANLPEKCDVVTPDSPAASNWKESVLKRAGEYVPDAPAEEAAEIAKLQG